MSELYYANLPEVERPHSTATMAHINLTDFEDYLPESKEDRTDYSVVQLETRWCVSCSFINGNISFKSLSNL